MSIAVSQLRRAQPEVLDEVSAGLERDRLAWMHVIAFVLSARTGAAWRGPAASAATAREAQVAKQIRILCLGIAETSSGLCHAANRLEAAREIVARADRLAHDAGGWIDADGRLILPARQPLADPIAQTVQAREDERTRWEVTSLIERVLHAANAVDDDLSRVLHHGPVTQGRLQGRPPGPALPPPPLIRIDSDAPDADVFASAAWWRVLSNEERRTVITTHPEWIGNRDGIPARDRHEANLILLARAEVEVASDPEIRGSRLRGMSMAFAGPGMRGESAAMDRYLDLQAVREVLGRGDPPRRLLLLDTSGEMVRTAVAIGDVDTADHVATFVGGFTTTPRGGLRGHDTTMAHVHTRTGQIAAESGVAKASTAEVVWMGYAAPQQDEVLDLWGRSVLVTRTARAAAPALARFVNGIDVSRDVPPHQVIDAHSYGSVVAAHTLTRNTGVDDVVLLGSPGLAGAFSSLAQGGLKPGSLNVVAAPDDRVARSGWFPSNPAQIPGALVLSSDWSYVPELPLGTGTASKGHSNYFTSGSTSVENLAAVTLGRKDLLILDGERRKGGGRD